jgi:hypothetical protein
MTFRGVAYIVAAVVLTVLLAANWTLFAARVELNLLVARVQTPLLVLMLIVVAVIALIGLALHASSRRAWTRERRTLRSEMEAARVRADDAEESRIAALRTSLERDLAELRAQLAQVLDGQAALLGRPADPRSIESRPVESRSIEPRPVDSGRR